MALKAARGGAVGPDLPFLLGFLAAPIVGALIASLRPRNAISWILIAAGVAFGVAAVTDEYARKAVADQLDLNVIALSAHVSFSAYLTLLFLIGVCVPLLFPSGAVLGPRWRVALLGGGLSLGLTLAASVIRPELTEYAAGARNPYGIDGAASAADALQGMGLLGMLAAAIASLWSLTLRFRRARGDERQRIKWFAFATALVIVAFTATLISWGVFDYGPAYLDAMDGVLVLIVLPASIGIAILRHQLYDIDRLINRTLVYAVLTVSTVLSYLALVATFGWLMSGLADQRSNELAVATTTLIVAALFQPARRRAQALVDRRLYRSRYDAARTLEAFQARLRDETDLTALRRDLLAIVDTAVRPSHLSVWLRESPPGDSGASS